MEIWEAALLGLLQGLTEFLPVSSSAHLRIFGEFLPSARDPGAAFTAITQIGTEAAVLVYFRREIVAIFAAVLGQVTGRPGFDRAEARLGWLIAVGTLPIVILGLLFADAIETSLRDLRITALALIGFGLVLAIADRFSTGGRTVKEIGWGRGIAMGFAQAMALVPGVSRSGATISIGLFLGLTREAAARYAFLLAIPAVFGSGFYQLVKSADETGGAGLAATAVATAVAFLVGFLVIVAFMRFISKASYMPFVIYRVALGLLILALISFGWLDPTV